MLNYLTQNTLLITIILILLVINVWYFFELESKKGEIERDADRISAMEEYNTKLNNELFDLRVKNVRDFMPAPSLREIVVYDCQFKINEVINYKGITYQISKAEYLEDPQTKIEQLHYHLTDQLGNIIIRSHDSIKDATHYVYKKG